MRALSAVRIIVHFPSFFPFLLFFHLSFLLLDLLDNFKLQNCYLILATSEKESRDIFKKLASSNFSHAPEKPNNLAASFMFLHSPINEHILKFFFFIFDPKQGPYYIHLCASLLFYLSLLLYLEI